MKRHPESESNWSCTSISHMLALLKHSWREQKIFLCFQPIKPGLRPMQPSGVKGVRTGISAACSGEIKNIWRCAVSGRVMTQAVSRRPVNAETAVRSRIGPCGICRGQSDTGTGF